MLAQAPCHWKKEKEERRLLESKISEIFPSPFNYQRRLVEKEVPQQPLPDRPKRQLIVDVHGRTSEPICSYHRCDHKFSLHGSRRCRCKHPTNKALGIQVRYF
jgi:hypothetical protein